MALLRCMWQRAGNRIELIRWLLEKRANVRKKDPRDLTPLDHAALGANPQNKCAERFPQVAALLLEHGAPMTVRAAVALGDLPRVRQFIADEPESLRRIWGNGGLLTLAVNHHQLAMAELLLDLGADVDERILLEELEEPTESWGMPLWHAAWTGDLAMSKVLLDRGADPNANVYASGWPLSRAWRITRMTESEIVAGTRGEASSHTWSPPRMMALRKRGECWPRPLTRKW